MHARLLDSADRTVLSSLTSALRRHARVVAVVGLTACAVLAVMALQSVVEAQTYGDTATAKSSVADAAVIRDDVAGSADPIAPDAQTDADLAATIDPRLASLVRELSLVRAERLEAEARLQSARQLLRRNAIDAIPEVQKSPVMQGLIAQRTRAEWDLAEGAVQLQPGHPRMKQLNGTLAELRRRLQREAATIVDDLQREVGALADREEAQGRLLRASEVRLGGDGGQQGRYTQPATTGSLGVTAGRSSAAEITTSALPWSGAASAGALRIAAVAGVAIFGLGLIFLLARTLWTRSVRERAPTFFFAQDKAEGASALPLPEASGLEVVPDLRGVVANDDAPRLASVDVVVARLLGNSAGLGGYRTLVTGASDETNVREEAADIAAGLFAAGRQVILVDWSPDGEGISKGLGLAPSPGFTELLAGAALMEDAITTLPDGEVHVLPCGAARPALAGALDAERINRLLDSLDAAYSDVVITGIGPGMRDLFRAIDGRVDAGIIVGVGEADNRAGYVLGFEVTDIDVMHLDSVWQRCRAMRRSVAGADGHRALPRSMAPTG